MFANAAVFHVPGQELPRVFLGHLKYVASLPLDFWDPTAKLSRYTVIKSSEADPQS